MATLTYSGSLTIVTCWCGIPHAIPTELDDYRYRRHRGGRDFAVYCPLGHAYVPSGESEVVKLGRQLEAERRRTQAERAKHDQTKAELRETERRRCAEKGAKTRIKNRVSKGVCPCCNRTFQDLLRHMNTQHPDFCKPE